MQLKSDWKNLSWPQKPLEKKNLNPHFIINIYIFFIKYRETYPIIQQGHNIKDRYLNIRISEYKIRVTAFSYLLAGCSPWLLQELFPLKRKLNKLCNRELNLALYIPTWVQFGYFSTAGESLSDLDKNIIKTKNIPKFACFFCLCLFFFLREIKTFKEYF